MGSSPVENRIRIQQQPLRTGYSRFFIGSQRVEEDSQ
jgi:hypothetical protein